MSILSNGDFYALGWFLFAWLGFNTLIEITPLHKITLSYFMDEQRRRWMTTMVQRPVRIMDVGIASGLQQGTAFFASTSLLAIGGCFALLNATERIMKVAADLPLEMSSNPALWEIKVLGLALIFAYAFFKFGWAYRLFNYATIIMGATPEVAPDASDDEWKHAMRIAREGGELMVLAGRHFTRGQRAFFFAVGYLGWFIDPMIFSITTFAVLVVITRRQLFSKAKKAALSVHKAPSGLMKSQWGSKTETGSENPFT